MYNTLCKKCRPSYETWSTQAYVDEPWSAAWNNYLPFRLVWDEQVREYITYDQMIVVDVTKCLVQVQEYKHLNVWVIVRYAFYKRKDDGDDWMTTVEEICQSQGYKTGQTTTREKFVMALTYVTELYHTHKQAGLEAGCFTEHQSTTK